MSRYRPMCELDQQSFKSLPRTVPNRVASLRRYFERNSKQQWNVSFDTETSFSMSWTSDSVSSRQGELYRIHSVIPLSLKDELQPIDLDKKKTFVCIGICYAQSYEFFFSFSSDCVRRSIASSNWLCNLLRTNKKSSFNIALPFFTLV
jgi:hypothetical protein